MKAIMINEHAGLDGISLENIDVPICTNNKVLVSIKASAINHLDIWVSNGLPGINIPLPLILGSDASGTIVKVGRNVDTYQIGDDVVIQPGTFNSNCDQVLNKRENYSSSYGILGETENGVQAEFVCLKESNLHIMSDHLTFEEASSMQLVFMTAYQMLVTRGHLMKDQVILIYGATSGVGSAAIQIAKEIGATVITTVGTQDKVKYGYDLGSDYVLLHNKSIINEIKELTQGNGVDMVCEHIGEDTWNQSMKVLKKGGKIVTCGSTTGPKVSIDLRHLFSKQQTIIGSTMSDLPTFNSVLKKINNNIFKPFIDKIFLFDDIRIAHERMESRSHHGKIVLIPK